MAIFDFTGLTSRSGKCDGYFSFVPIHIGLEKSLSLVITKKQKGGSKNSTEDIRVSVGSAVSIFAEKMQQRHN